MELADFVRLGDQAPPLRFLIIGGYAVGAHGHTRATFDVDFLVRRMERDRWFARYLNAGLRLFGETRAFAQFVQAQEGDVLVMRPLLLHASSPAKTPSHRRVIHLEYACGALPNGLRWFEQSAQTINPPDFNLPSLP